MHQDVWKVEQGLPQNTVPAIVQSSNGYLWIGTELGLARFDGLRFTTFDKSNTPELKSNKIDALVESRNGDLWVGTVGGGLTQRSKGKFRTFTTKDGLSGDSILSLLEDRAGDLWIGTNGHGLNRYHDGKFTAYTSENGLADNEVFALAEDRAGNIWAGTHDGLSRFAQGVFHNYGTRDGLPSNYIRCLSVSHDDALLIGADGNGLWVLRNGAFQPVQSGDQLSGRSVSAIREDNSGNLWVGTIGGGITRLNGTEIETYASRNGLPSNDVWSIFEDHDENIWVGTGGGGLTRLASKLFTSYGADSGLSNDVTLPVFEDREGTVWIGTNGGGLNRFRNGRFTALTTNNGLASNLILTIGEDPGGGIWVGTTKGLNRIQNRKVATYTTKDGLPSNIAIATYTDREGRLWIGTRAGLSVWTNNLFTTYTTKNGLSSNVVQAISEGSDGSIWIGTAGGGLDRFKNGHFEVFDSQHGLSNDVVFSIYPDSKGELWIGTDGGGLNRFKNGKCTAYTTRDGFFDDAVFRIMEDGAGNLWMSSNKGVFRASIAELNDFADRKTDRVATFSYGRADGMNTRECNGGFQPAGLKSHDGRLWFPTMKGVTVIDPQKAQRRNGPQPVVIEEAWADRSEVNTREAVSVGPGRGELEFRYSAPNFRAAERVRFRYKLDGFDRSWIEAGDRRVAYYTNIPHGTYRFEVQATDNDGTWSPLKASLAITLEPHFYETWLFYGGCAFGLLGLVAAAHSANVGQLRARKKELELRVEERTAQLRRQIAERERAEMESVRARESAEKASLVKSEFLANMSHEIRTPMSGILGMTDLALKSGLNPDQQQYLEIIKTSADCLLTVINDILDFSKVEAGKLDLELIDFNLRQSLGGALRSLALPAAKKNLKLSLEADADVPEMVRTDPGRLRQILINLVSNAIKFTDAGKVTLTVRRDRGEPGEDSLHFVVWDTGIGIAPEKLHSIFEPFSQADSSTARRFGGTGLGLAICSRLVALMGGKIWAESELGRGSEFHFSIPFGVIEHQVNEKGKDGEAKEDVILQPQAFRESGSQLHVLVAEDNPANRMVARLAMEQAGFKVFEAANGEQVLEAVMGNRLDVVLMDCRMPVMDGYEAARHVRRMPGQKGTVPIIALTASAFKEDRDKAREAGMNDFVAKPFEARDLISKCLAWGNAQALTALDSKLQESSIKASALETDSYSKYSPEFLKGLFESFLESAGPAYQNLVRAIKDENWTEAKSVAHWLRGGAVRIINPDLQQRLGDLEAICGQESPVVTPEILEALDNSFRTACFRAEEWMRVQSTLVSV